MTKLTFGGIFEMGNMGSQHKLITRLGVFLLLSLSTPTIFAHPERRIDPELQHQIDDFVASFLTPDQVLAGMALTVVKDEGDLIYTTGYGLSNVETGTEFGNRTQIGIGSLTKSMTSVLVVKILSEKFPDLYDYILDTPIHKLLPPGSDFILIDRYRTEHLTFRDLLSHMTCLEDTDGSNEPFNSTEDMMYRIRYNQVYGQGELSCELHTVEGYNNQMYAVAGVLIGIIAGKPYESVMQDLWNELGMTETTFIKASDNFTEMPYRAMPHYMWENRTYLLNPELAKRILIFNGAGGIFSTPNDLSRYLHFHMNRGRLDGKQIIPASVMRWTTRPSIARGVFFKELGDDDGEYEGRVIRHGYGLGLELQSRDGWELNSHPGFAFPYFNYMTIWPGKKMAVYTGVNVYPMMFPLMPLHEFIYELFEGNPNAKEEVLGRMQMGKWKLDEENKEALAHAKSYSNWRVVYEEMLKTGRTFRNDPPKVGRYGNGAAGDLELSLRFNEVKNQTQLFLEYGKWLHGWLEPVEEEGVPGLFRIDLVTDLYQQDRAYGFDESMHYAVIPGDDTVNIAEKEFRFGEGLDTLPVIPWDPNSC